MQKLFLQMQKSFGLRQKLFLNIPKSDEDIQIKRMAFAISERL
jgi:hypothetical protein